MIITLENISKSYAGNLVLNNVNLEITEGQIHALVGENGAGKSTLMKILIGVEQADEGSITINGQVKKWRNPIDARSTGIAMVYQELSLVPSLTVVENIFLGRLLQDRLGLADWNEMKLRTREIFKDIDFAMDVDKTVEELSIAEKQMVEIGRALAQNAELIILDEPTSPLTEQDAERLFERMRLLRQKGVSIVYITHRLEEVFAVAQHISILRDGDLVRSCAITETDMHTVVKDMVGRELSEQFPPRPIQNQSEQNEILCVQNLSRGREFQDVGFNVRSGEILGIAGLVGAGRTELMEAIFGVTKTDRGTVTLRGRVTKINSPTHAVRKGIGLIADDRKVKGLVTEAGVDFNLCMAAQRKFSTKWGWRQHKKELAAAGDMVKRLRIKLHSLQQHVSRLSGGNQQKVAIGKSLNTESEVLIFDEPTRGIDVGAKREIYFLIRKLAENGTAIILVSSEMEEIVGLADRIIVMHQGCIAGELNAPEATPEKIMRLAIGMKNKEVSVK